mmetsp:Transcript_100729/g.291192  ORF Transcript_100729/g.291192 Transcript_100729/m.291192 type:complete len:218 (+) Transcript_100729:1079-1732(+)
MELHGFPDRSRWHHRPVDVADSGHRVRHGRPGLDAGRPLAIPRPGDEHVAHGQALADLAPREADQDPPPVVQARRRHCAGNAGHGVGDGADGHGALHLRLGRRKTRRSAGAPLGSSRSSGGCCKSVSRYIRGGLQLVQGDECGHVCDGGLIQRTAYHEGIHRHLRRRDELGDLLHSHRSRQRQHGASHRGHRDRGRGGGGEEDTRIARRQHLRGVGS